MMVPSVMQCSWVPQLMCQSLQSPLQVNNAVTLPGEGISIQVQHGRPDIAACLRAAAAAAEAAGGGPVGVFAGGPRPMMRAVHLAVAELNGRGHHFELHNEAVEL